MPFIEHIPLPLKKEDSCQNPEHNPPTMIVLPAGQHTYQCPECGKIQTLTVMGIRL